MAETFRVLIAGPDVESTDEINQIIGSDPEASAGAAVHSPEAVLESVRTLENDIMVIDLGIAGSADSLVIVKNAKAIQPELAVIVISSVLETNLTMKALAAGAVEYVAKDSEKLHSTAPIRQLESAIRSAKTVVSKARGIHRATIEGTQTTSAGTICSATKASIPAALGEGFDLILIGISTGGPSALEEIFSQIGDNDLPPILIVQHMGRLFTTQLASSLEKKAGRPIKEAWRQSPLKPNCIYVAPGGFHTEVRVRAPSEEFNALRVVEDPPVNGFCPSVDVCWQSVARHFDGKVAAFLMTGMGEDGAIGMSALRESGAYCVAQDEESSVVWGMPGAAVRDGSCHEVMSLDAIAIAFKEVLGRVKKR